jgi:hypothetical protein
MRKMISILISNCFESLRLRSEVVELTSKKSRLDSNISAELKIYGYARNDRHLFRSL